MTPQPRTVRPVRGAETVRNAPPVGVLVDADRRVVAGRLVVGVAGVVAPLALFVAHVLRAATVAGRTVSISPFAPS